MKEPVRLLAGGGSNLERRLLESAQLDRMPVASLGHLSRALGMPNPAAELAAVAIAPRGTFAGLPVLVMTAALLAGFSIEPQGRLAFTPSDPASATVDATVSTAALPSPAARAPFVTAAAPPEAPERASGSPPSLAAVSARSGDIAALRRGASGRDARSRVSTPPRPRAEEVMARARSMSGDSGSNSLGDELRSLEAIQGALSQGHAADAARALLDHRQRFASGELTIEADLLEIDIEVARGQRERAIARARALLDRPEAAHYRKRLLSIGSESGPERHPQAGADQP
jgi:hypothetical protein